MLLHLLSRKSSINNGAPGQTLAQDMCAFDRKWDQLLPRRPVQASTPDPIITVSSNDIQSVTQGRREINKTSAL